MGGCASRDGSLAAAVDARAAMGPSEKSSTNVAFAATRRHAKKVRGEGSSEGDPQRIDTMFTGSGKSPSPSSPLSNNKPTAECMITTQAAAAAAAAAAGAAGATVAEGSAPEAPAVVIAPPSSEGAARGAAPAATIRGDDDGPRPGGIFDQLPMEILRSGVLPFVEARYLMRAGVVCRAWREASLDDNIWKPLCLGHWVGKHVALLEALDVSELEASRHGSPRPDGVFSHIGTTGEDGDEVKQQLLMERAARLEGGLEDIVAAMPIKAMMRRLEELGANPRRLTSCLEKGECVSLVMSSMLLSREGLLREAGQLPPWTSSMRGWRWSFYYAKVDSRRCWLTMDDLVRTRWTMNFPAQMPSPASPHLLPSVTCEFHRNFAYTDEGFHQDGLEWHFEDSHRCVKVSSYPALEAERDESWGWRLINAHVVFEQQRGPP